MANKSIYIDKAELGALQKKLLDVGGLADDFNNELADTAKDAVSSIRSDFGYKVIPHLERRGEDTEGLSSSIKRRTLKRKKGLSAYSISAGGVGKELMAYAEFGTRTERINLAGIRSLFGGDGDDYAERFKGGDNPKNFTNLSARPYFFHNIYKAKKDLTKRLGKLINDKLKKK